MASSHFSKLQFLLLVSLLLLTLFESTSGCGRRRRRYRPFRHHTTTERYYGKRSVDNAEYNEVGNDDYENSRTSCGQTLCPKATSYPTNEIIDAVDRLHQHLRDRESNRKDFEDRDRFFTSARSKTLSRRPADHWYFSDPSGCKQHATVSFPQEGYNDVERQAYYVVNVPNLRQSVVQYTCTNADQTCARDKAAGASRSTRTCQQKYGQKELVVLPTNKRRFEVEDFKVVSFVVSESCACASSPYADNENMIW